MFKYYNNFFFCLGSSVLLHSPNRLYVLPFARYFTSNGAQSKSTSKLLHAINMSSGLGYKFSPAIRLAPSPWPFCASQALCMLFLSLILIFQWALVGAKFFIISFFMLALTIAFWVKDLIVEAQFLGLFTSLNLKMIRFGMLLFIASEVMFFFALFWTFFYFSLNPSIWIGCVWPPLGIEPINPFALPLLNTILLLSSGVSVTFAHMSAQRVQNSDEDSIEIRLHVLYGLFVTLCLGLMFTLVQLFEFSTAPFSINDSAYGSVFFFITGFHGLHVIVGLILLLIAFVRFLNYHFFTEEQTAFELSAWYWHFVDGVWLFVYSFVYVWGGI